MSASFSLGDYQQACLYIAFHRELWTLVVSSSAITPSSSSPSSSSPSEAEREGDSSYVGFSGRGGRWTSKPHCRYTSSVLSTPSFMNLTT